MSDDVKFYIVPEAGRAIPFDVIGSLMPAIGHLWPGAKMGPGQSTFGHTDGVSIIIPADERAKPMTKAAARKIKKHRDEETGDAGVIGYGADGLTATTPEDYRRRLGEWAYMMLTGVDGAINYVEQGVTAPDGRALVVIAAWSEGQTPHALRMAAEKRADAAEARLRDVEP